MASTSLTKEAEIRKQQTYNYIIVDGMNMSYKYYYGLWKLESKSGVKTGIYHGFLSMILGLKEKYPGCKVIVAWEGDNLIRKKTRESYKANRIVRPDNLEKSLIQLKKMLALLGICQKFVPGYEADDVAAYYCDKLGDDCKILLISEDSDWLQVMNKNCSVMRKNIEYNYDHMMNIKGYPPERILLYKMIKGDPKDNISGIPYFPTKLANDIVKNCKNLEEAFKYIPIERMYLKWMLRLKEHRTLLTDNYEILKLRSDVRLEDLPCRERKNISKLKIVLMELQLYKVLNQMKKM